MREVAIKKTKPYYERLSTAHGVRLACLGESEKSGLAGVQGSSPGGEEDGRKGRMRAGALAIH